MSNWKYKISIKDEFIKADENPTKGNNRMLIKRTCSELEMVLPKLKAGEGSDKIDSILYALEEVLSMLEEDYYDTVEEFQLDYNYWLDKIYEWGDMHKLCWIETR